MSARVVDTITPSEDLLTGGEDWMMLTSPLVSALDHNASTAPEHLYVAPSNNSSGLALTLEEKNKFESIPTAEKTIISSPLLGPTHTPIVLIGNAGVGKTSWIKYFISLLKDRGEIRTVYYSQKAESGRPFLKGATQEEKFEKILFRLLVKEIQSICREHGKTGLEIFNYSLDQIERSEFESSLKFTDAVNAALKHVYEAGMLLVLVIDDMDHFDDGLQKVAFEAGEWLSQQPGINVIIPMRTFTYGVLDVDNKYRPRKYFVSAPNLKALLTNRLNYEWDVHSSPALTELSRLFHDNEISLELITSGKIEESLDGLRDFHGRIVETISENDHLQKALYSLHNENIDEIAPIVSQMIVSKFFATTFRGDIISEIPSLKQQEKIVTAYLRGPYGHYRGTSSEYPVADISLICPNSMQPSKIVLPVHILNYLLNQDPSNKGIETSAISDLFSLFGYTSSDVKSALKHLWKLKLIHAPAAHSSDSWDATGVVTSSLAGKYVVGSFLKEFAFRFFEANADVYDKPLGANKGLSKGKSLADMAENALNVFDAVCSSWEQEIKVVSGLCADNSRVAIDYLAVTDPYNVRHGIDWIKAAFDEVSGRASALSKSRSVSAPDEKNKFKILREQTLHPLSSRISEGLKLYDESIRACANKT